MSTKITGNRWGTDARDDIITGQTRIAADPTAQGAQDSMLAAFRKAPTDEHYIGGFQTMLDSSAYQGLPDDQKAEVMSTYAKVAGMPSIGAIRAMIRPASGAAVKPARAKPNVSFVPCGSSSITNTR